ncbi:MAG: flagellar export protein FliJ [Oligoflexia bacterium]
MKRFKFRLEAVQKIRKRNEEEAMRVLADARHRLSELLKHGESLQRAVEAALIRKESLGAEPVSGAAFKIEEDFIAGSKLRIAQLAIRVSKAQRAVEKAMRFFIHARRQLHVIETLREREFEAFKRQVQKREQKEMDDLVTMRAGRALMEDAT